MRCPALRGYPTARCEQPHTYCLCIFMFLPFLTHTLTGDYAIRVSVWRYLAWFVLCLAGAGCAFGYYRRLTPLLDAFRARFSKKTQLARDERTDIRTVTDKLPPIDDYD